MVDLTSNAHGGAAAWDTIRNIEVVHGTNFDDSLTGIDNGGGTGELFYDVDSSGGVTAIKFAAVTAGTALSAANLLRRVSLDVAWSFYAACRRERYNQKQWANSRPAH
ncbi:hypothetical protein KHP60_09380 [Microvirga sp. 3-52]|uniref:hypothetical protein n=1 Tax=Microvirga sp. 3-52 TaxID=2792425 RepID=UPI001AC82054|nr:hypothetical protein [Microvirga sp. 3-52]MBO1905365.1 hypothetical protein [Microvirga sp. 3-52]MBS7452546.1 hypothetical protein [Microvirga sp. 3-52]